MEYRDDEGKDWPSYPKIEPEASCSTELAVSAPFFVVIGPRRRPCAMAESMDGGTKEEVYGRSTYQSQAHKLATLFIMTAGSANASQFPMMFIVYGGAPFLLAYLTFLATIAMPMMHLESSLAQFSGDGNRGIFSTVPLFIGLGYTMSLYAILHIVGDSVAMSDYLMYFLTSLKSAPWTDCPEGWPTHNRTCYPIRQNATLCRSVRHRLMDTFRRQPFSQGIPLTSGDLVVLVPPKSYRDAAAGCVPGLYGPLQSFYMRRQNDWMESSFSQIQAQPLISLAAVWMLVFALAHRGFNKIKRLTLPSTIPKLSSAICQRSTARKACAKSSPTQPCSVSPCHGAQSTLPAIPTNPALRTYHVTKCPARPCNTSHL
ncbi:hypothetical protein ISCGN_014496 [Ixodes scapularis]